MSTSTRRGHQETIVERYMPNATQAEREAAQESLNELAKLIVRILTRIAREEVDNGIRQNVERELESGSALPI
jgi:hypothetical protein